MEYKVVKTEARKLGNAIDSLESKIRVLLACGWKLQGGISIAVEPEYDHNANATYHVAQAMIKED